MKILFLIIWITCLAALAGFAIVPNIMVMNGGADKMLHLLAFCMMTIWPAMTFNKIPTVVIAVLGVFAMGVGMEIMQGFVPGRKSEFMDIVFNMLGIATGAVIGALLRDTYQSLNPTSYAHLQIKDIKAKEA